ncbi:MAG: ATP-grasp domain-containing protein, partial [Pseudomonadota bacterium]|nr:ATP-grasp domain-containing protein [Pseudomonadota bacterium]
FSPAAIPASIVATADNLAHKLANKMQLVGLMAIEMFVTAGGEVLVNEIAPRPHNSGHHTVEGNITSQYEQLLRAILNLPLGATTVNQPAAMVNLLGEPGYQGIAQYHGVEKVLALPGAYLHLYGKKNTKPFRKMGHVTILDDNIDHLSAKVNFVKQHLKVMA